MLIGGALGGVLFAFLSLPVAGVLQASMREYSKGYDVVDDDRIGEASAAEGTEAGTDGTAAQGTARRRVIDQIVGAGPCWPRRARSSSASASSGRPWASAVARSMST